MRPRKSRETSPATTTIANGFCESDPIPVDSAAGSKPRHATSAVIITGRNLTSDPSNVAFWMS